MQYRHLPAGISLNETGSLAVVLKGEVTPPFLCSGRTVCRGNEKTINKLTI